MDLKKKGETYTDSQRQRLNYKIKDSSPQGFHYKSCEWEFAVELTTVKADRIEGRWESYPRGARVNPATCEWSAPRFWEDAAWIRE